MEDHVGELMSIPGVVGVAIGETAQGVPCIQVLIAAADEELQKQIPETLEGHPVVIEVSGIIRGMADESQDV